MMRLRRHGGRGHHSPIATPTTIGGWGHHPEVATPITEESVTCIEKKQHTVVAIGNFTSAVL